MKRCCSKRPDYCHSEWSRRNELNEVNLLVENEIFRQAQYDINKLKLYFLNSLFFSFLHQRFPLKRTSHFRVKFFFCQLSFMLFPINCRQNSCGFQLLSGKTKNISSLHLKSIEITRYYCLISSTNLMRLWLSVCQILHRI